MGAFITIAVIFTIGFFIVNSMATSFYNGGHHIKGADEYERNLDRITRKYEEEEESETSPENGDGEEAPPFPELETDEETEK